MTCQQRAEYLAADVFVAILRLSYTYLKNTSDAQDICQSVFVKLLTQPQEFESVEHERAYILRMAANACKDLLKSPWRQANPAAWRPAETCRRRRRKKEVCFRRSMNCRHITGP